MADLVKLVVADKPVSFADVAFTEAEWKAATARGPVDVFPSTAMEALRNSRGLYRLEAPKKAEVELKVAGMSVEQMESSQLKMMAAAFGKPIRKQMSRASLIAFVKGLIDAVPIIDDEEEVSGDPPSASE